MITSKEECAIHELVIVRDTRKDLTTFKWGLRSVV